MSHSHAKMVAEISRAGRDTSAVADRSKGDERPIGNARGERRLAGTREVVHHSAGMASWPISKGYLPSAASTARARTGWNDFESHLKALDKSLRSELHGRSLKPFQVAALIGNLAWESHTAGTRRYFDPRRYQQPAGPGFGLAQWGGTRLSDPHNRAQPGLEQFVLGRGAHSLADLRARPDLLSQELKFAVHELGTDYKSVFEALVGTKTLAGTHGAIAVVEQKYEVAGDRSEVGAAAPRGGPGHAPTASYWYRLQLAQYLMHQIDR
jgi:hypothetical protein